MHLKLFNQISVRCKIYARRIENFSASEIAINTISSFLDNTTSITITPTITIPSTTATTTADSSAINGVVAMHHWRMCPQRVN